MTANSCELCAEFELKIQAAYEDLAEEGMKGRREGEAAQRKLSRLLSAKHAHQGKQGCSHAKKDDGDQSLPPGL